MKFFPHFNRLAGRPIKPSPLYDRPMGYGAVYEEVYAASGHAGLPDGVAQEDHTLSPAISSMIVSAVRSGCA